MSFGHLPGAFLEIFFWFQKATLGSRLPLNVSRRPWRPSSMSFGHLPAAFLEIFFQFQKATLGSTLPLNVSRRPGRPSSMSFGHLPGAFLEIFFWFQKLASVYWLPWLPLASLIPVASLRQKKIHGILFKSAVKDVSGLSAVFFLCQVVLFH